MGPNAAESMDRITDPFGLQSAGTCCTLQLSYPKPSGPDASAIIVTAAAVRHDAGAVKVVVSGPLLNRVSPEREVAVGMIVFMCERGL